MTLEQKIDICLEYITTKDPSRLASLRKLAIEALATRCSGDPSRSAKPSIDMLIDELLLELGIPTSLLGYSALVYAIKFVISDESYLEAMTTRLYTDVGKCIDRSPGAAQTRIHYAVRASFDNLDLDYIYRRLGLPPQRIRVQLTPGEFIHLAAKEIKRRAVWSGDD